MNSPPPPPWTVERFANEIVGSKPDIEINIVDRARDEAGMSAAQAKRWLEKCEEAGSVSRIVPDGNQKHRFCNQAPLQTNLPLASDGGGEGSPKQQAPRAQRTGGVGGRARTPPPPCATSRKRPKEPTKPPKKPAKKRSSTTSEGPQT